MSHGRASNPITPGALTEALKGEAARLGFDLCGAVPAAPPNGLGTFRRWLERGFAGEMHYLAEQAEARGDWNRVLEGTRSVLMLATNYRTVEPAATGAGQGRVSHHAWGADYHDLTHDRLRQLKEFHLRLTPRARVRGVVDSAPVLEREFAVRAGLGWIGKNTTLIHPQLGSWTFLAALLTTEELQYDAPLDAPGCGECRACLDACPTGALREPYTLDARRCISYLTIEQRGEIPTAYWEALGDRVFGCDACQEACPHNRCTPGTNEPAFQPRPGMNPLELIPLLAISEAEFRTRFRGTPLFRAKRSGLLRNAAVAMANRPAPEAVAALRRGTEDIDPLVQATCQKSLERIENRKESSRPDQDLPSGSE